MIQLPRKAVGVNISASCIRYIHKKMSTGRKARVRGVLCWYFARCNSQDGNKRKTQQHSFHSQGTLLLLPATEQSSLSIIKVARDVVKLGTCLVRHLIEIAVVF